MPKLRRAVHLSARERASRGEPVLICILARSLGFHAVTPERSSFRENPTYVSTSIPRWIRGIACGAIDCSWSEIARGQTDRHAHTPQLQLTLAAHARRGLQLITCLHTVYQTQWHACIQQDVAAWTPNKVLLQLKISLIPQECAHFQSWRVSDELYAHKCSHRGL